MPRYFNAPYMQWEMRQHHKDFYSHVKLESLPTVGLSHKHVPLSTRFVNALGGLFLGMTRKFHIHWGEVGATDCLMRCCMTAAYRTGCVSGPLFMSASAEHIKIIGGTSLGEVY